MPWFASEDGSGNWYARRATEFHTILSMASEILNPPEGFEPDHILSKPSLLRRSNLRLATRSQNLSNRGKQKNNTSGFTGAMWRNDKWRWVVQIKFQGNNIFGGYFDTKEEAALKYNELATYFFGEFAKLNKVEGD